VLPGGGTASSSLKAAEAFQAGGVDNAIGVLARDVAHHAGNMVFREAAADIAAKNDLSLTQMNAELTALSFAGNALLGSRVERLPATTPDPTQEHNLAGILSRDTALKSILGLPFDAIDIALNHQGLPSASEYQATFGAMGGDLRVSHSLGASGAATLTGLGAIQPGVIGYSLPIGRIAPSGMHVTNGLWDWVNGGPLGKLFNPFAKTVYTGDSFPKNHFFKSYPPPVP